MSPTLTIYTMTHCSTSDVTRETAALIEERMPDLHVVLVDLEESGGAAPPEVFSVPTYLLNGKIVALGNPYVDQLEDAIRNRMSTSAR